ncbi:MAG: chitobiase/beta-hexosaminidase C-terminal domain-containing protein, partial [Oscillospiraceae bacterium]|nr:chitobiase/beta-hexosaminidase C-terminal domain-containing protein [Oscillospiraceae bacterium]
GIGGGLSNSGSGSGSYITISGGTVTATGGDDGAGIGGGCGCDGSNIEISGGTVTATGSAGIGGGYNGSGSYIEISGGVVTATGGIGSAGIGGGNSGSGSYITISGGKVTATSVAYGAGIGGGNGGNGSNIEISGGVVTATGGDDGAGIGGGGGCDGSNIEISGGTVTATGGEDGAGIGGGWSGSGSDIKISGGTVTATGGDYGAGIGGGRSGSGSNIKISGGSVKAVAGEKYEYDGTTYFPAAIGQGVQYDSNTGVYSNGAEVTPTDGNGNNVYFLGLDVDGTSAVTINGKAYPTKHIDENILYVYLPAGNYTVANGNSQKLYAIADNGTVSEVGTTFTITGTDLVYGTDYTYADGVLTILSDKDITIKNTTPSTRTTNRIEVADGVSANITLAGVNIDVSSQIGTAAFKIADDSTGNVTITLADGTTNTLKSGMFCAGLQKNGEYSETLGKLTITGTGTLTAQDGYYGAGIGGGNNGSGSNIEISGGTVTATGGEYGAGIGGGASGSGSYITISGGTVTATGGKSGAGIGGGDGDSADNIKISGGEVTANGGKDGAGIGGGWYGSGSNITISGGTVTATGGEDGAGIGGGGEYGSSSNIEISGGTVKASSIGCTPTDGTANVTPVYPLEFDVDGTSAVTINGKAYPTKHFDENKVYIYLPAKTAQAPNEVTVGNETTKYCYINAKWLKVVDSPEADDTEFTYDGTEKTYTLAESDYYTITGNKQTNAGTYTVTVALNDKDNTVWNDGTTDDKQYTFTIIGIDATYTAPTPIADLVYDGTAKNLINAGTTTDGEMQYSLDGTNYSSAIPTGTDAKTYTVWYKVVGDENHNDTTPASIKVSIAPKSITVTADNASKTYGEDDPTFTYTATGLEGSDTLTGTLSRETGENAGTYAITQGTLANPNYDITFVEGTFTINKATPPALTIPTATTITYGEKLSASTLSDSSWAWVDGTIVPNANAYYNAYIEVDDSNYDYTSVEGYDAVNHRVVKGVDVIINRATLTITASSYTIKVGSALPTYEYTVTGLVNGDTLPFNVSLSCSATDSNAVGTYPITISGVASDALASLYAPIYENGKLIITEKEEQTITASDVTLTYGETGKKITATTSGDGAISYSTTSDVISVAADGTITILKVGTATVTVKAAETDNYAEATKTISVTVNKKKVAIPTADTTEYTYTGTAQTYGVTSTDDYTVTGGTQTNAGEYPITITLNNENYEWDGTLGTYKFVINKAAVTVTAKSYTIKVGEALPTYAYDVAGLVNGETLPIDVTISCTADGKTAGAFDIVVSGATTSTNYTYTYVNGTLTVSEKEVVAAPTFTPASGTTFTSSQKVTISCATDGATIYYTTDGSTPTTASTKYTGAITITSTTTIKAIAVKDGMGDSSVVTAKYTKNSGGSGGSGGGSGGGGGYRPPVVPDDDDDDNDDVVVNDPEDNEDKPDNGNEPQIKGDNGNTGWDAILDELDDADEGDKIVVDMNGETEVPEDVFEQIKGQDIDLVIELDNGFIWTINGKDVTNPADIDLGVNKGSTIPVRAINAVTGECEYITITLAHNGEFGFKAVLTVDMGVKNEGYFANLYWYTDNDTKFICADKIDNKGRANLVFTHASEYVIVIDENDHTPEDDVSAGAGIEEDSSEIPDDFDNDENPYTGVAISFAGIIISAAAIMIARKRKKQ